MSATATSPRVPEATSGGERLADLRARIALVRSDRRRARLLTGGSRMVLAIIVAGVTIFLLDWTFSSGRLVRCLMLLGAAVAVARVYWRRVRPGLAKRESEIEIALAIEKQQGIDSDLVAALEFADNRRVGPASATTSGSAALRDAVIEYVADFGRTWQMPPEATDPRLRRRMAWLAAALVGIGAAAALRPDFAGAFLNRMFLGSAHYPTRTRIESLVIGGTSIDVAPGSAAEVQSPLGRAVGFEVGVGGEMPRLVRMRLESVTTGDATEIELLPDIVPPVRSGSPPVGTEAARPKATFAARLPKLVESVDAQVFAGDAWTDPVRVMAIAPPLIDLAISATPPAYAGGGSERPANGARQVTVLEGSHVGVTVRCTNKKLASATLVIDGVEYPLRPTASPVAVATDWELVEADSPLARLERTVSFELRVVDEDGLGTDVPLVGSVRAKPDAPPRVTADAQTRLVLPRAAPRLTWRVADDHAVAAVTVVVEAIAAGPGGDSGTEAGSERTITIPAPLPVGTAGWVGRESLPLEGSLTVPLQPLGLAMGDQVRITVRAADYRGAVVGREAESEPIVLEVTDEQGILAALTETDERSVQQLDAIIDRELRVGGGK